MKDKLSRFNEQGKKLGLNEASTFIFKTLSNKITSLENKISSFGLHAIRHTKVHTTVGGAAIEEFSSMNVKPGMTVVATIAEQGAVPVSILSAKTEMGKVTITFSGNPSTDHKVNIVVFY